MSSSLHNLPWRRFDRPVLSALTTEQSWCTVQLYNPTVVKVGGVYRMWYLGNRTATRVHDVELGYAESTDGLQWTEHPDNPLLTARDLPRGTSWQTPHVTYDKDLDQYRMWFIMMGDPPDNPSASPDAAVHLGYASSADGIGWAVHPEPLWEGGRGPCVLQDGPDAYRMWMNARPTPTGHRKDPYWNIFRFTSLDGMAWTRDERPALTTVNERLMVYPCVVRRGDRYTLWCGRTGPDRTFEIYASTSNDGLHWTHHLDAAALPATRGENDFDGRYTSTPCFLEDEDHYLMYYSARDWGTRYTAGDGSTRSDKAGIYRHIGVAVCPK